VMLLRRRSVTDNEHLNINEIKTFSAEKRIRKKIVGSEKISAELIYYEPGQATPQHVHPKQDEIFHIIECKGIMVVEDEDIPVGPSSVILVPSKVRHGIKTFNDSRLVVMFTKAPVST
jgi:mannose-6-phosphate isomerase-like protein (cupin superfamily)